MHRIANKYVSSKVFNQFYRPNRNYKLGLFHFRRMNYQDIWIRVFYEKLLCLNIYFIYVYYIDITTWHFHYNIFFITIISLINIMWDHFVLLRSKTLICFIDWLNKSNKAVNVWDLSGIRANASWNTPSGQNVRNTLLRTTNCVYTAHRATLILRWALLLYCV